MEVADLQPDFVEGFSYIKRRWVVWSGDDPVRCLPDDATFNLPRG
jgi:hypothetical protein